MAKKPFPFSVCKECCSSGEGGETVIINEGGYKYKIANFTDVVVPLDSNTVTYVYGEETVDGSIGFAFNLSDDVADDTSEEIVLILDLSLLTENPSVMFPSIIKWYGGEPPTVEAGKAYMFSFVRAKTTESVVYFYLGIGGEFA